MKFLGLFQKIGWGLVVGALHFAIVFFLRLNTSWIWAYYLFFFVFSGYLIYICNNAFKKNSDRVGLTFMMMIVVKMLLFALAFSPLLFTDYQITVLDKVNMLIPFLTFLILEVIAVFKLLNIHPIESNSRENEHTT